MSDIEILNKLLEVEPLPSKDENKRLVKWTEVDNLIDESGYEIAGGTNVNRLRNYLIAAITALPKQMNKSVKLRKQTVHLAGKVWTHLILNGHTYSNAKKPIRDAVKNHFFGGDFKAGEDFLRAPDVKFDDRERTIKVNAAGEEKADKRQESAVEISAERVEKIVAQMKADVDSGDSKYNVVAILLGDLCFGSRWVESLMFSKFEADPEPTETGRNKVSTTWVTQTGISKKFNRGVDNRNFSVRKPCLPYINADYVIEKITAFRAAHTGLKARLLKYDSTNKDDVRLANQFRSKANKLLHKRYFQDMFSRAAGKLAESDQRAASSHLLRAIWVNLSYELFHKKGQAKDKYVKDTLGHDSYSPGVRYKDILIVPAKEDDALTGLSFGNVTAAELKKAEKEQDDVPDEELEDVPAIQEREDNLEEPPVFTNKNEDDAPITQKQFKQLQKQNVDIMKALMSLTQSVAAIVATLKK